ncbi:MAG: methyltransferase domain-containing protein [Actinomycetia bacterium]|nr:methyltransferase domain-containing protein [Actinomycetes bacterium]
MADIVFDATVAARYDRFCETEAGGYVDRVEHALLWPLLELVPGLAVVDLGCGTGAYTVTLAEAGCRAVGVDISPAMLAVARTKVPRSGSVRWIEADLANLPFPDRTFDRGLLHVTLEFVDDPARVLQEAVRVLVPGGRLVVGLILTTGPWAAHYRQRARLDPRSVWRRAQFFDPETVAGWLGRPPDAERRGLWVGPEAWPGLEAAWQAERAAHDPEQAGFVALAWRV